MKTEARPVILVVGQTPPPHHGQSIMLEALLQGHYPGFRLVHARMAFSETLGEVSRFQLKKVFHLIGLIRRVLRLRRQTGATVLYYPPAGAARIPIWRDILFLLCTRRKFTRTIFHFHAGGLSTFYPRLTKLEQFLFRRAYDRPDLAIRIAAGAPEDGAFLQARTEAVVPNGIEDLAPAAAPRTYGHQPIRLLFLGALRESKGILVLLEACQILREQGRAFHLTLAGPEAEPGLLERIARFRTEHEMEADVTYTGVLTGEVKTVAYAHADLFVFPTFYEAETFGIVLLEAMSMSLPVVATRWRGTPEIVQEGVTGRLVPPRDARALAEAVLSFLDHPERLAAFGHAGRRRFLDYFTLEAHRQRMGVCLRRVAQPEGDAP